MVVPSHYWTGPLAALVALALVVLVMRWVFAPPARRPARPRAPEDFGLLVPVATAQTAADADALRARLRSAGIRCTVVGEPPVGPSSGGPPALRLLVFPADAERASRLVRS